MTKVYSVSNFIQKHFIGGYELYAKQNLRAKNKRLSEASEINAVGPEDSNGGIDATIVDEENGILFDVKLRELPEGELPTEKSLKKSSIFELKSEDGKTKKFLISNAVAKLLKEQPKIDGDHLYMMDLDESAEFDANVASSSDCYKPSTYLSLLTGEKSYAVAAGKGNRNDTFSTAGTGSNRTAAAKFIDPLAELIKPEMKQYGDNSNEKSVLKGPLSKSRVMVSFLIASVFIMGALLFLTFGGAPILGIGIMATIPLYVALPAAIGPFGLAVVLNIFSKPYVEKTLTKRHKVYNFIANPANKAVLVYSAVSVLIALVVMPFFGPLTFAVAGFSVLMLIASRVDAAKGRSLASGTFMFFAVTPWLMGAVRYLITSGILLKPLAAGLAWVYERITNWNFHTKMSRPSQYVAIFLYFIGSFLVGLLSGVAGIFGIKIPLSRVNFDQTEYGKDARDTCHWIAVHIAANVGRLLVLSLVISTVVMTIAYTSGIAALISGLGFISSIPVVGSIMSWLFISGPMSFFLSSTVSVVSVVLGGAGFSIFLAYPIIREAVGLVKELARFNSPVAGGVMGLIGLFAGLIFPPIGIYIFVVTTVYFLITIGRLMMKMDRTRREDSGQGVESEFRNEEKLKEKSAISLNESMIEQDADLSIMQQITVKRLELREWIRKFKEAEANKNFIAEEQKSPVSSLSLVTENDQSGIEQHQMIESIVEAPRAVSESEIMRRKPEIIKPSAEIMVELLKTKTELSFLEQNREKLRKKELSILKKQLIADELIRTAWFPKAEHQHLPTWREVLNSVEEYEDFMSDRAIRRIAERLKAKKELAINKELPKELEKEQRLNSSHFELDEVSYVEKHQEEDHRKEKEVVVNLVVRKEEIVESDPEHESDHNEDEEHQEEIVVEPVVVIKEGEDHLETHPKEIIIQKQEEIIQDGPLRNPVNLGRSEIVYQGEEHHEIEEHHETIVIDREYEDIKIERPEEPFTKKMIEHSFYRAEQELDLDDIYGHAENPVIKILEEIENQDKHQEEQTFMKNINERLINALKKEPEEPSNKIAESNATEPKPKRTLKNISKNEREQLLTQLTADMKEKKLIVGRLGFFSKTPSFKDVEDQLTEQLRAPHSGKEIDDLTYEEYEAEMYRVAVAWQKQGLIEQEKQSSQQLRLGVHEHNVNESSEIKTYNVELERLKKHRPKFQKNEIREMLESKGKEDKFTSEEERQLWLDDLEKKLKSESLIKRRFNPISKEPTFKDVYNKIKDAEKIGPIKLETEIRKILKQ